MEIYGSLKHFQMVVKVVKNTKISTLSSIILIKFNHRVEKWTILLRYILWEQKVKKKKFISWTSYVTRKWFPLAPCKISWPYEVLCPQKLIFSLGVHIWTPGPLGIQRVKVALINVIAILMMSTKLTTPSVLKITIFWNNHEYMLTQTAHYFLNMWCVARFGTIFTL